MPVIEARLIGCDKWEYAVLGTVIDEIEVVKIVLIDAFSPHRQFLHLPPVGLVGVVVPSVCSVP